MKILQLPKGWTIYTHPQPDDINELVVTVTSGSKETGTFWLYPNHTSVSQMIEEFNYNLKAFIRGVLKDRVTRHYRGALA